MLAQIMAERGRGSGGDWMPVNVFEDGDAVVVEAALPKVRPEDVDLDCTDNVLTIQARSRLPHAARLEGPRPMQTGRGRMHPWQLTRTIPSAMNWMPQPEIRRRLEESQRRFEAGRREQFRSRKSDAAWASMSPASVELSRTEG
jgi:hypothetical protein